MANSTFARNSLAPIRLERRAPLTAEPSREPWTLERRLHLALAGIAVVGWVVAYTALTRGIDGSHERVARSGGAATKVSVNLVPQTPDIAPAAAALR